MSLTLLQRQLFGLLLAIAVHTKALAQVIAVNPGGRAPVVNMVGLHPVDPRVATGVVGHQALAAFVGEHLGHFQHQLVTQAFGRFQGCGLAAVIGEVEQVNMHFA